MENPEELEEFDDELWDSSDEEALDNRYLSFEIGEKEYCLEIRHIIEIVCIQHITEVPDMPRCIRGVINLRGQVIPVMDVRKRFVMSERDYDDRTCVIVTSFNNINVGLIVDTVSEVLDIPKENISPPPSMGSDVSEQYIRGLARVDEQVNILLDLQMLLNEQDMDQAVPVPVPAESA